MIYRISKVE